MKKIKRKRTAAEIEHELWKRSPARRRGRRLGLALEETLPAGALALLRDQTSTYLGQNLGDVLRFVVVNWLHENAGRLPRRTRAE